MKVRGTLLLLILSSTALAQTGQVSILIDPGHGGKDPGHLPLGNSGLQEKVLTLEIANKVGGYLSNNLANVNVAYTRTDDSYPTLDERVEMANSGKFNYMLSIHINGNPNSEVHGTETIIHDYQSSDSHNWARLIENQFKKRAGRKSRGVKTSDDLGHTLQVLKFTKIPTVVVECGFITNVIEAGYLSSINGQEIIASAIFRATREFLQMKHPETNFIPTPIEDLVVEEIAESTTIATEDSPPVYKIQIMASIDPIETDIGLFKKLNYPVERVLVESTSLYKYKYYVGAFESKKDAKPVQKEIQENGFADAFITYVQ